MSIADKLVAVAENVEKIYNAGFEKGKSEGGGFPSEFEWVRYNTQRPLFTDDSWAAESTVIYVPNTDSFAELFYNKKLTKIKTLTIKSDVPITNVNYCLRTQNDVSYAFLERVVFECDFSDCNSFSQFLQFQRKLVSIGGQPIDLSGATSFSLGYLVALESFRVEPDTIKGNFSVADSPNLDTATIQSIIDGLVDLTDTDAKTITLSAAVIAKISEDQLTAIAEKNWNLV